MFSWLGDVGNAMDAMTERKGNHIFMTNLKYQVAEIGNMSGSWVFQTPGVDSPKLWELRFGTPGVSLSLFV